MTRTAEALRQLPFVTETKDGLNLWAVEPTGDYSEDCATGRLMASILLDHMQDCNSPSLLAHVVKDMPATFSGTEIGFFSEVAECAAFETRAETDTASVTISLPAREQVECPR